MNRRFLKYTCKIHRAAQMKCLWDGSWFDLSYVSITFFDPSYSTSYGSQVWKNRSLLSTMTPRSAIYYDAKKWLSIMTPRSGYLLWRQGAAIYYDAKEWQFIMTPRRGYPLWRRWAVIYYDAKEWLFIMTPRSDYLLWRQGVAIYYDKQRVLTPGHQGWNDLHSLCRIGMGYYLLNDKNNNNINNINNNNNNNDVDNEW